jgi:uncharacterized membrane protein
VIFSQGLVGAGIAILYLSAFAAFSFYHLVSQPIAFGLMGVVTVVAFLQAFRYDSLAVSLLAWLGGFLTPLFLSTGEAHPVGLFTYLALLNVGMLAVLLLKERWTLLEPLSLTGTYIYYFGWYATSFTSNDLSASLFFLTVFWLLFHGLDTVRARAGVPGMETVRRAVAAVNGILFVIGIVAALGAVHPAWRGGALLLVAVLFGLSAWWIFRARKEDTVAVVQNMLAAVAVLVLATGIEYEGFPLVSFYALETALVAGIAARIDRRILWATAPVIAAIALPVFLAATGALRAVDPAAFTPLVNRRTLALLSLVLAVVLTSIASRRFDGPAMPIVRELLHYGWIGLVFILLTVETADIFRRIAVDAGRESRTMLAYARTMTLAAVWALLALPLLHAGLRRSVRPALWAGVVITGLAFITVAVRGVFGTPAQELLPVANMRALSMVVVAGTIGVGAWSSRGVRRILGPLFDYGWIILLSLLATAEVHDALSRSLVNAEGDLATDLTFRRVLLFGITWGVLAVPLSWQSRRRGVAAWRNAAFVLAALGGVVVGFRGIAVNPIALHLPIFNLRFLAMALLAAIWAFEARQTPPTPYAAVARRIFSIGFWILPLLLISGEVRDFYELALFRAGEAGTTDADIQQLENLKQLVLSSSWLVYSVILMVIGLWKRRRDLRLFSIALFAIAILKIFFIDLSFMQTLYRIFSFGALGLILLGVSYLYQRYRSVVLEEKSGG